MGMRFRLRRLLAIAALSAASAAFANTPATVSAPTPEDGLRYVQDRKAGAYREVLAAFDAAQGTATDGVTVGVARCRFIGQFTDDEYGEWVESAPDDFESCQEALEARWPDAPDVRLFALEQMWGEEAVTEGEKLLKGAGRWPTPLRRELLVRVSEAQEQQDNVARAGELALLAARLGEPERVALAVEHLVSRKQFAEAERLLVSAPPATTAWRARERVEAALALPDRAAALKELQRYARAEWSFDVGVAARAHLRAGDIASARKLLTESDPDTDALKQVRFDAALETRDYKTAAALVRLTDTENFADNLQRFATLATRAPGTLLLPSMLLAALICMALLAALALVPALLLLPVHYRGLARRVHGKPLARLFEHVGLKHAWWAVAVFLCVPMAVGMAIEPAAMATVLGGEKLPDSVALFRMMLWGTVAGLLFVLPGVLSLGMRGFVGKGAALRASWRVLVAWAALVGIGILLSLWHGHTGAGGDTQQTKTVAALAQGGREAYGPVLTFFLVAVLVPIFEELVFRGLLLGGLASHISFGWSNVLQAALFALSHDDPPRLPFYFAMGLMAGWLVKRTHALGPAIALHVLNNGVVFLLRML